MRKPLGKMIVEVITEADTATTLELKTLFDTCLDLEKYLIIEVIL